MWARPVPLQQQLVREYLLSPFLNHLPFVSCLDLAVRCVTADRVRRGGTCHRTRILQHPAPLAARAGITSTPRKPPPLAAAAAKVAKLLPAGRARATPLLVQVGSTSLAAAGASLPTFFCRISP